MNKRGSMLGGLFGRLTGGIGVGGYGVPGMGGGGGKRESLGSLDEEGEVGMGRGGKRDSQVGCLDRCYDAQRSGIVVATS